ncbi:MCE family protein [Actinoallomurus rhizosphaericola]|uniref:MCE family protein n=1 Tax=Actinoallomurus rhizosphaericola TaxID=2952536 RepID=UPI00209072AA|nr:MCE family protein [Actinoallomurus rhizosphaericola]MCO5994664.1 MCE family protein [Actinoallomurus rhizosphaericola]
MIIKRGVKIQLTIFAIITVLTMAYTLVNIIGIGQTVLDLRYRVYLDMADSGGIFTNAEVTYRGVTVGRVGPLRLTKDGVRVELRINHDRKVPANGVQAYVLNRSGVGEQYVDLRPAGNGPSLKNGDVIPRDHTHLPVQTYELLHNIDALVRTVDPKDLGTVINELDKGLSGEGADLQSLLDSNKKILAALNDTYPETIALLNNGRTVLDTQVDEGSVFREFSHNLASLTAELKRDDPDVRTFLNVTPGALDQGQDLLNRLEPTLPTLLANGSVIGSVLTSRTDQLRTMLITYPLIVGGAFSVTPGDGTVHFGLELNFNQPPVCTKGYEGTKIRYPQDTRPATINAKASCKAPKNAGTAVRGSRNAPPPGPYPKLPAGATSGAGFPYETSAGSGSGDGGGAAKQASVSGRSSASGGSSTGDSGSGQTASSGLQTLFVSGYDPRTRVYVGPDGKQYRLGKVSQLTGDASWQTLLLSPIVG